MRELQVISIVISSISLLLSLPFILGPFIGWLLDFRGPKVYYSVGHLSNGSRVFEGNVPQEVLDTARVGDVWFW